MNFNKDLVTDVKKDDRFHRTVSHFMKHGLSEKDAMQAAKEMIDMDNMHKDTEQHEEKYNDMMIKGLETLPMNHQDRIDISMELTNDDEDLALALANSNIDLKNQKLVNQFIKRHDMKNEDFNKELHEMQLLAGIGTGVYGNTKTPVEKQYKVGDGMTTGCDSVSENENDDKVVGTNSNKDATTDIDANLYFPKGSDNEVSDSAGPASAKQGDNAMQKSSMSDLAKIRKLAGLVKEDVSNDVLEESKKLVGKEEDNQYLAKIYYDREWQEYRVKLYVDGIYQGEDSDYHTDDKEDAFDTAKALVKKTSKTVNEGYLAFYNMLQEYKKSKGL
jgi:hypothetical protein